MIRVTEPGTSSQTLVQGDAPQPLGGPCKAFLSSVLGTPQSSPVLFPLGDSSPWGYASPAAGAKRGPAARSPLLPTGPIGSALPPPPGQPGPLRELPGAGPAPMALAANSTPKSSPGIFCPSLGL